MQSTQQGDTCLSPGSLQPGPPAGPVRPSHVLQHHLIIIPSLWLVLGVIWQTLWNPPHCVGLKNKRHGSFNGCLSKATVFILSTAPNAQCVIFLSQFLTLYASTPWQDLNFIKSKVSQNLHHNIPSLLCFLESHFYWQTSNKKQRHTLIKQNSAMTACNSLIQPVNRQK